MNEITQEMLVDAAYLMQGYRSKHGKDLQISNPNSSELDTVAALVEWVPKINAVYAELAENGIYPTGVFSYETTEPLGEAIGDKVKASGVWPDNHEVWAAALPLFKDCYGYTELLRDEKAIFDEVLAKHSGTRPRGLPYKRQPKEVSA